MRSADTEDGRGGASLSCIISFGRERGRIRFLGLARASERMVAERTACVTVGENGRLVLPAPFRKALGLAGAGQVVLTLEGDAVRITSVRRRLMEARDRLRRLVPARRGMADALIEERRAEAAEGEAPGAPGIEMPPDAPGGGGKDEAPTVRPAPDDPRWAGPPPYPPAWSTPPPCWPSSTRRRAPTPTPTRSRTPPSRR